MALKIKKICYNGKVIAPKDGDGVLDIIQCIICGRVIPNPYIQNIKRVVYNGKILWPGIKSADLIISSYDNTIGTYNGLKGGYKTNIINSNPLIKKVIYNGNVIWPRDDNKYLNIEKEYILLNEFNNWEDTNQIHTNTTFTII